MRGFGAFLAKELAEIVRTWRIWVLPGMVLFFAVSGPPLAALTPELVSSLVTQDTPGLVIQLPDPTYLDAYGQWAKNLSQIVLFAVIIMFGGMVSSERRSGTAALVLAKPLDRSAFIVAKAVSHAVLLTASVVVGAVVTWGITLAVFGEAPLDRLVASTAAWLVLALLFLALMEALSASIDSQAGAAGLGLAAFMLLSIATLWGPLQRYSPAGLMNAPAEIVVGKPVELLWPLVTTATAIVVLIAVAASVFRRREL